MWLARFSVRNPVLVNMIMIVIIVVGTYSLVTLPRALEPNIAFNWVFISTIYPGIGPEEAEKLLTIPIEDEIADVDDIEMISSDSGEDGSFISVKFENISSSKFFRRFQDLKSELDKVDLPKDAETPEVVDFGSDDMYSMIDVVLTGDLSERQMKKIAEELRDDILDIKHVSRAQLGGVRDREIWVEADPQRLNGYHLALSQVIDALSAKNLNLAGGNIKIGRSEYVIRTKGEFDRAREVENVIIRASRLGDHLRVKDIAEVKDAFEEWDILSRLDGKSAVTVSVTKKPAGNSIRIIDGIKDLVKIYEERYPDVRFTLTNDTSIHIKDILHKLQSNAWIGLLLVIGVLYLTLGWRNALFTAIGIPVTFMATFIFMKYTGRSFNSNSLFGLVMVLGIIVDDAIIVVENCYRYMQKGMSPVQAAIVGTKEVAAPVIVTVLTTVAAFLPLMLLPGIVGKFMAIIPIVVSLALVASLFEALVILPSHVADWGRTPGSNEQRRNILLTKVRRIYAKYLVKVLRHRYRTVAAIVVIFFISLVIAFSGVIDVNMFGTEQISQFMVWVTAPEGTNLEATDQIIRQIEKEALKLPKEEVEHVVAHTGMLQGHTEWYFKPSVGQVTVDLVEQEERQRTTEEIIADLRERTKNISGINSIEFAQVSTGPPVGAPVQVKVKGKYLSELVEVAELVKDELRNMDGVFDIKDDFIRGKKELTIEVDEDKASLYGLSVAQIAMAVRNAFEGGKATVLHDGDEEVDVVVKFKESARQSIADVENMQIATITGGLIPFRDVARINVERGYSVIKRFDRQRAITVYADVDKKVTSSVKVNNALIKKFADISQRYPGYKLDFSGEFEEFKETFSNIGILFLVGVLLIFLILGGLFKSFVQPLIILFTVPFAFIGAMIGLLVGGYPISVVVLFGVVALAGVAVNDALVLISFINNAREKGMNRWKAIMLSGKTRMRPVLLTSITTMFGLLPMAFGIGGKSEVWAPLANTIVWGLAFATILTLFIIPCLYAIVGDIKRFFWRRRTKGREDQAYRRRALRVSETEALG